MSAPELLPLHLDVIRPSEGSPPSEHDLYDLMNELFLRDHNTCRYCGMYSPSKASLEIDHLDGNHGNWNVDNLVTACLWCHGCHHLEFSLNAGAKLVQWDYPQVAISRITQQIIISGSLFDSFNQMVEAGTRRREQNFPGGELAIIINDIPRLVAQGKAAKAKEYLEMMEAENIRLAFPTTEYLSEVQAIPGVSPSAWRHFRRYYIGYVNSNISDANVRAMVFKAWKEMS
ncbi:HNH endonuclease [Vreelandella rituensis]|uniref:HNH endonuclease n=1 Tax=Vreelandella rituensis TaxID=2282306 RepID=A0A368UA44_9GAMM|nr:HNH endonuclease [Halomonas rituensis]RCV93841.1 HNH endonuclease [Halomonas rituensis]